MAITTPQYYAVASPTYQPAMRNILSITQANPALITTTFDGLVGGDHDYLTGLIVRIFIPVGFGMLQMDKLDAQITVVNDTQFTLDIDSTAFDAFSVPAANPGHRFTPAQVMPTGEINSLLSQATRNVL